MINYKLLTPGPLTTSDSVKKQMLVDHCTWDDDYKIITQNIRKELLDLAHVSEDKYTTVLLQGSGTYAVESVLISAVGKTDKVLILVNGAYSERMVKICKLAKIDYTTYSCAYNQIPDAKEVEQILSQDFTITHVAMVHCETTSGILNDILAISKVVKIAGKTFIVDAMSSFGGVEIDANALQIDYLISSANKCIQGVPGFAFVICKKSELEKCKGKAHSLSLDLYDQYKSMNIDGKWRFTSPTHVVLAFYQALQELKAEGGICERQKRYTINNRFLIEKMNKLGIKSYVGLEHQSPIITTFICPLSRKFSFNQMYFYIKQRGYAIYPGKLTDIDTFRIGNIGEIYIEDMEKLCDIFEQYFETIK